VISVGGAASVSVPVPTTGTPPYRWSWRYSLNDGVKFEAATSNLCAVPSGSGALPGAIETCRLVPTNATAPGTYEFELKVSDSASAPESILFPAPAKITVLPSNGPRFDTDPGEYCTGTCTQSNWFAGTGGSGALTLSTGSANELLVLEITDSGQTGGGLVASDISDTQSSTWQLAASNLWNGSGFDQYVFYAIDPTAGSDTVTVDSAGGTPTTAATATGLLAAFSGVDTSAPIDVVGAFDSGTGTAGVGDVTANVSPTTVLGILSTAQGASSYVPTASPAFTESGSVNDGVATASYLEYYGATATGTYLSQPSWTGTVAWGEVAIAVQGANPLSVTVSPTSVVLDQGQSKSFTATESGGSGSFSYAWSVASGSCPGFSASSTSSQAYDPSGTTASCVLTVTVTDTPGDSAMPTVPASVVVNSQLTAPAAPSPSATALDINQAETVTAVLASTGTAPYSWQWEVSVSGGAYAAATQCAANSGSGASGGATETCSIAASTLTSGDTYAFKIQVTDSASTPTSVTSAVSSTITVKSALTAPAAPTLSAAVLDVNQGETVSGTVPSTGTSSYSWLWLISVNGGAYATASQCGTSSGTGASGGAVKTCVTAANALTAGDTYTFEFQVTDSATTPETQTSPASATLTVHTQLTAPSAPSVSATKLDVNQALTATSTLGSAGTSPYAWQWEISINGGSYASATQCGTNSGTGASGGATETCSIAANTLTASNTYAFKLEVTDSASTAETATSSASSTVDVASTLTAPAVPTPSSTALDVNQALTVMGTIPSTGTATYSWQWLVSVNGGSFADTTQCSHNSGTSAAAGATETCSIAASALTIGDSYAFELEVTDSATNPESATSSASTTVTVASQLTAPATPSVSATLLDVDQTLTVTGTVPSTGSAPYAWQWLVSVNGGADGDATLCSTNSGSGASAGATETCTVPGNTFTAGDSYTFELQITDSATTPETTTSAASSAVAVSSALTAAAAPTPSATALDVDQALTVSGTVPSTGTPTYSWQWLVKINGASPVVAASCGASASGSGATAGQSETCTIPANSLTIGDTYAFEFQVTDHATVPETTVSGVSGTVTVSSELTAPAAPTLSATALDANQALTVTSHLPSTGTPTYSWQWLVSVNGGVFGDASECGASESGSSGGAGAAETCTVPANTLSASDSYTFELEVSDSATNPESATSSASGAVAVAAALGAPTAPSISSNAVVDLGQTSTLTDSLPSTGTATYSWQWLYSTNGGTSYSSATASECATPSGSGGAADATVTCSFATTGTTPTGSYLFELKVTDSATTPETATSSSSAAVTVNTALTAPTAPTLSATKLDLNQALTVTGTVPSTGTSPYAWQWLIAVNGGAYADATQCATNSGTGATAGSSKTCSVAAGGLTSGDSYTFELKITDSATTPTSASSSGSSSVSVASTLVAPAAPTIVSGQAVDLGQTATLTTSLPTTGTSPYAWTWMYSTNGGSSYSAATSSICANPSGSSGAAGATVTCTFATTGTTSTGSYLFELKVTDSATSAESATSSASPAVAVSSALTAPAAPTVSATTLDADQSLTVTDSLPSTGTSPYAWEWLVSVGGGPYTESTYCATNSGTGGTSPPARHCAISGGTLSASTTYTFELEVSDSASSPESATSAPSPTVTTSSALSADRPTPAAPFLDLGQSIQLTANPTGGSGGYAYQWAAASSAAGCDLPGAVLSGQTGSTLLVAPSVSTYYCYNVTDSNDVSQYSPAILVVVNSALTAPGAPTPSASALDADQTLVVTGTIPSTGTPTYNWTWLVEINGAGGFVNATQCGASVTGSGAIAGATVLCTVPGGTLLAGDAYTFELYVNDSATASENATSAASASVSVSSALLAPNSPVVSGSVLDANQALVVTGTLPDSGTGPYSWTWWIAVNGGAAGLGTECAVDGGTGASGGASEQCSVAAGTLSPGDVYTFFLSVSDSASVAENVTSAASATVTVHTALVPAGGPGVSATRLDSDQALTVSGTIPATGTPNYSWQWLVSVDGGTYAAASVCRTNTGSGALAGERVTCAVAADTLTAGDTYNFELSVRDNASTPASVLSPASNAVAVAAALSGGSPTPGTPAIDAGQSLTLSANPVGGSADFLYQWYSGTSASACTALTSAISGATAAILTVSPSTATFYCYTVTDSASTPENATSVAVGVSVNPALTAPSAPTVNAGSVSASQGLTVTGTIPSTGTPTYSWQWLVSVNGGPFVNATVCTVASGSGAAPGATETCVVPAGALISGDNYVFELRVADGSAAGSVAATSPGSSVVQVTAGAPSSFPWIWVAVAIGALAAVLVAFLVLRRRRSGPRPAPPEESAASTWTPAPVWRESAETSPIAAGTAVPVWQEKSDASSPPAAPAPSPPEPMTLPPTAPSPETPVPPPEEPAPASPPPATPPVPPPPTPPPADTAPAPAPPEPVPTPTAATAAAPPPEVPPPGELDFDSVMAELDDLSRQILRKSQRKPGESPPEPGSGQP
jgi:hypothetical protein